MERQVVGARVTRVDSDGNPWVEVPEFGLEQEYGPCQSLVVATLLTAGARVFVSAVAGVTDDLVVLGVVGGFAPGSGSGGSGGATDDALHANPDFEVASGSPLTASSWSDFWGSGGGANYARTETSPANVSRGARSSRITLDTNGNLAYKTSDGFTVAGGRTLAVAWVARSDSTHARTRAELLTNTSASANPDFFDGSSQSVTPQGTAEYAVTSAFKVYTAKFPLPADAKRANLVLRCFTDDNSAAVLWLDDTRSGYAQRGVTFTFAAPGATSWVLPHNLGERFPSIVTTDLNGKEVGGDVFYLDENNARVDWARAVSGYATVNP